MKRQRFYFALVDSGRIFSFWADNKELAHAHLMHCWNADDCGFDLPVPECNPNFAGWFEEDNEAINAVAGAVVPAETFWRALETGRRI